MVPEPCQFQTGDDILDFYGYHNDRLVIDIFILLGMAVGLRMAGLAVLYIRSFRK